MPKVSVLIPAAQLAEIDAQANGNRTAFMIEAAIERAKRLKRAPIWIVGLEPVIGSE